MSTNYRVTLQKLSRPDPKQPKASISPVQESKTLVVTSAYNLETYKAVDGH